MNFLIDESVDAPIAARLVLDGHTTTCVWELWPGISDDEVLAKANQEQAILITADKDFGELVFRMSLVHEGIILIRLAGLSTGKKADLVSFAIRKHGEEMRKAFSVITPNIIKVRRRVEQ